MGEYVEMEDLLAQFGFGKFSPPPPEEERGREKGGEQKREEGMEGIEQEVPLVHWSIAAENGHACLLGTDETGTEIRSAPVTQRIRNYKIASGSTLYLLQGNMVKSEQLSSLLNKQFKRGFPVRWREYLLMAEQGFQE